MASFIGIPMSENRRQEGWDIWLPLAAMVFLILLAIVIRMAEVLFGGAAE